MSGNTPNMLNDDKKTEMTTIQPKERESPQASTDLWSLYLGEANQRAKDKADVWNESLSAFLLFAGLFAGVVAAFLIDSRAGLHPSPSADSPSNTNSTGTKVPVSTLAVNFLWFISLTLTLISALGGVLGRTWIVKFSSVADTDLEGARLRWIHDDKAEHWHLHAVIAWITGLIQLALFLFLAGLAIQATTDHQSLGLTILPLVGATLILYIGITLLPIPSPATPYRTPFSDLFTHNEALKSESAKRAKTPRRGILELIAPLWRKLIIITEDPEVHVGIGWAILQQSFRDFVESAWTKLFKIPEDPEVHLGICWAVLQHSSQTATIHAAVRKLTGGEITPYQCQLLAKFGLPRKLSSRLVHLPLPTEAQADAVERLKNYLHVVMWMVGGCSPAVAEGFSILLRHDSLLHKLDALPTSCQGVAFAIQVHLLINIDTEEEIHNHGTDWTAMIDSLDNSFALDVFRAAIRGLEFPAGDVPLHKKRKFSHLRQDCARMLAAYNGSTCFSNTDLVRSQMTADPLHITQQEQEPVEQIHALFLQLEEAWKRSMCTRAVQLLEEVHIDRQIMGFQVLSSVTKDVNFRDAMSDVLPELGRSLKKVNWETSVECLRWLLEIYKQDSRETFRAAFTGIVPKILKLSADSKEEVHTAARELMNEMGKEKWAISQEHRILREFMADLASSDWHLRVSGLEGLAELVKMDIISTNSDVIGEGRSILACTRFPNNNVQLATIRTLQELANQKRFYSIIDKGIFNILTLALDEDSRVRAAAVDFVSELAEKVPFQLAINRSIPSFITDNYGLQQWFARCGRLQVLGKIIQSGQSLYDSGIRNTFRELRTWLSDPDEDVRQEALQIVALAAEHAAFSVKIKDVIPRIVEMFNDEDEDEDVRAAALATCTVLAKVQQAAFKEPMSSVVPAMLLVLSTTTSTMQIVLLKTLSTLAKIEDLITAIHNITKLFESPNKDVRLASFETWAEIVKTHPVTPQNSVQNIRTGIMWALSSTQWHIQIAALQILSTFAETDGLCETLDGDVLEKIISGLSDDDVQAQTLDTLAVLASKGQFHNKVQGATRNILPLLEGWDWSIRQKALDTFAVFARNGILKLDDEITLRMISMLSEADIDTRTGLLNILFMTAKQVLTPAKHLEILVLTNSLNHPNWRVRVAALEVLGYLADDPNYSKINFPALITIVNCISDKTEEKVQLAGLRTLLKFLDVEIFQDGVPVSETVLEIISSLLKSSSEDSRISAISIISSYSAKAEFFSTINNLIPMMTKLLEKHRDSDTRVAIIETLCDMAKTDKFWTETSFLGSVRDTLSSLLSDKHAAVRMAALQILPLVTKHNAFHNIVHDSLEVLLPAALREDTEDSEEDNLRIKVINTLADLAKNDIFRGKIDETPTPWSQSYEQAASRSTRIALLNLMSVLGAKTREPVKAMVAKILPEINDTLHDSEDSELRMAAVQLLSIPAVKEIPPSEFNSRVSTLVTLLSDPEEKVRITALHTLSELAKQEVFRGAINQTLPALLDSLEREEWNVRFAALKTCAALAEDMIFSEFLKSATIKIAACMRFPDDDVQREALVALSRLSREEAFRLDISNTAPDIMSKFGSSYWNVRLQVLGTLSVFMENDAFGDIIHSVLPSIVECLRDSDEEVRTEAAKMLVTLVQHKPYQPSLRGTMQGYGETLADLISDHFRSVRITALALIPKVVQLDVLLKSDEVSKILFSVVKLLSEDKEEKMCIAALDAITALVNQDASYVKNAPAGLPKLAKYSVDAVVNVIPAILSRFERTREQSFWDAATQVLLVLAGIEGRDNKIHNTVVSSVIWAVQDSNPGAQILGLTVLAGVGDQDVFKLKIGDHEPRVLELLHSGDLDVRPSALCVVAALFPDLHFKATETVQAAIETAWQEVSTDLSGNPSVVALERLAKLSGYVDVFRDEQIVNILPTIIAGLKDHPPTIVTSCLHAFSKVAVELLPKLAADARFHDALPRVVPKIMALWSTKRSDTQLRFEILQNLFIFAKHQFHAKIGDQVSVVIVALKDGDAKVRGVALKVLLKLVERVSPDKFMERIKSTVPVLFTLINNVTTVEDSIKLISCLAGDKTLRIDMLARIHPSIYGSSQTPTSWGHLRLLAHLFEEGRLRHEETDLQFFLCLVTSKRAEVQNFVLKYMITMLQQYLRTWTEAKKFPTLFSSAFSSLALLKN